MSSPVDPASRIRTVGFRPGESNVFLHLLTACNLSCRHCYINPAQHGSATLDAATAVAWLGLFVRPGRRGNLVLLGGEPTMHPDLAAIIRAAKQLGYASVTVDSNGFLFHDLLQKTSPTELDCLSFSLDGPEAAVNDPLRGAGVFDVCTTNIRRAVALGFTTSLIYTVSRHNIEALARMPPLLEDLGIRRFFIQVIGLRGKPAAGAAEAWQVDQGRWLELVPQVALAVARRGIEVIFPKVFLDPAEDFACAGNVADNYFIFPNGRVYRCPLCEDHPVNALRIENNRLLVNEGLTEDRFFTLNIPEGCVMNKLLQPDTIEYDSSGHPLARISCCLLKQGVMPD